jgi:hypothetical protein
VLDFHCGQTQHEPIVVLQRRVLIDSTAAVEAAWRAFAGWYALAAAELLEVADGWRSRDVVERFADRLPVPVGEALARLLAGECPMAVLPGAVAVTTASTS